MDDRIYAIVRIVADKLEDWKLASFYIALIGGVNMKNMAFYDKVESLLL